MYRSDDVHCTVLPLFRFPVVFESSSSVSTYLDDDPIRYLLLYSMVENTRRQFYQVSVHFQSVCALYMYTDIYEP